MKHLLLGAAALALLTGCNGNDSPSAPTSTLSELVVRDGDPAKAADALAAMALSEGATGVLTATERKVSGDGATFTNLSINGSEDVKIGSLVFEGLNMEGDVATFGKMTFSDIAIQQEGEDSAVNVGKIELINPSPALSGWLAATLNGQEAPFPSVEDISFGSASISNISAEIDDAEMTGAFGLGKFEIRDMADLKAARFLISGITFDGTNPIDGMNFTAKLDEMSMLNVDAKYLKAIEDNMGDEEAMMAAIMDVAYENPMEPGYDAFALKGFDMNLAGAKVKMGSLDSFIERNSAGQPVKYVTKPYTISIDADADGGEAGAGLLQGLSVLGYERLVFNGESVSTYDPDKDLMSFDAKNSFIELEDGARFSMGGKLGGIADYSRKAATAFDFEALAAGAEPDPNAMNEAFGALTIYNFTLNIDDDGLLDRGFNAAATANGQDPAALKSQAAMILGMAPMMAGEVPGLDMALLTDTTGALSKFISNPGSLSISMQPKQPLSVASIMANPDPAAYTKDSLGYSISAK